MIPATSPREIDALIHNAVTERRDRIGKSATAAAIQAAVGSVDEVLYLGAAGRTDLESAAAPVITIDTPFDIASITKSLVGSVLAMQAVDEDRVRWDTPIHQILAEWGKRKDTASRDVTFLQILNHSSGLPAWRKFYLKFPLDPTAEQALQTRQAVLNSIISTELETLPGTAHAYSDLGYLLLSRILEVLFDDAPLSTLARTRIFQPLGLSRTRYVDRVRGDHAIMDAVVTETCSLRDRLIRGTVHDENTNIIGGVSAHAGVFSTASDLLRFGQHLLAIDQGRTIPHPLVRRETLQFAWSPEAGSIHGSHRAGWDTPSGTRSSAGSGFHPDHSVGHLGFSGTSLWIERRRSVVSVLLTNRVYPTRENESIKDLRIAFQNAILAPTTLIL